MVTVIVKKNMFKIYNKYLSVFFLLLSLLLNPISAVAASSTMNTTSLSFSTFMYQVLKNNPAVQAAQARVVVTQALQRAAAKPLYNPELTAQAQDARENTYSVGIDQTIDWSNKQATRTQVSLADVEIAKAQLADLRQQVANEILSALVAYQTNVKIVALTKERTKLLKQFLVLTQKRHTNGDIALVDVDLAQLALSEAITQQADAEIKLNQASQTLQSIIGNRQEKLPILPPSLPILHLTTNDINKLLYQLPIIQIFNNQYLSAKARIKLAIKQRNADPTIGLQGGYENGTEGNGRTIALTVSIPLFIRNNYHAEVDAASADTLEAEQKEMNVLRQTQARIENSAQRYQMLYQAVHDWQMMSNKPLSDGVTLIERLWQAGEINTTDYLVQLKQRIDSQVSGVELNGQAWQAWVAWLDASGQSDCSLVSCFPIRSNHS